MRLKAHARLALAVILGCAAALAQPQPQAVSGVFQVVVVEDLGRTTPASTESLQYSLVTGTETLRLIFEDPQAAERTPPGSLVEVTGYRTGKQITVPAESNANARITPQSASKPEPHIRLLSAAVAPKTIGQRKVAVLLVTFQNDQRQLVDSATISAAVFGDVNAYYQEDSYGNLSIVGDVYGYFNLPIDSVCHQFVDLGVSNASAFGAIQDAAVAAAQNAGTNLAGYDSVMIVGPELQSCTGGEAAGTVGGTPGYIVTKDMDPAVYDQPFEPLYDHNLAHEIGHNLGLYHAKFIDDGNAVYSGSVPSNLCGSPCYVEYGDFDVMGLTVQSKYHFNAPFKEFVGWLQPQVITTTGNYLVSPYETSGAGTKALKILPPQANDTFYIEYRQPIGFDSDLMLNGPTMRLGGNPAYLLNLNPLMRPVSRPTVAPPNPDCSSARAMWTMPTASRSPT